MAIKGSRYKMSIILLSDMPYSYRRIILVVNFDIELSRKNICILHQCSPACCEESTLTILPEPQRQLTQLSASIRGNEKALLQGRDSLCVCVFYVSMWWSVTKRIWGSMQTSTGMYTWVGFLRMCVSMHMYTVWPCGQKSKRMRVYYNNINNNTAGSPE